MEKLLSEETAATKPSVLRRKLHELETELTDLCFRHTVNPMASDPRNLMSFDDVKQRFRFLGNLLSRERESQPQNSHQLLGIGRRLAKLHADFHRWNESRTFSLSNDHEDDAQSVCSDCTQALLYNVGRDSSPVAEDFPGGDSPEESVGKGEGSVKKEEDFSDGDLPVVNVEKDDGSVKEHEEEIWSGMGKYCGVFGFGVIVGAIFMVKLFSSPGYIPYEVLLIPPT